MPYQVLARKYRPQRFADVAGQAHVTVTLINALTQGRIAHGYIFSGHRGIGKTTVARILAMALNCRTPIGTDQRPTAEPCEVCDSCTEIRAGNAVDVIEIDAATNRGIDEIRELRDAARYRPARDRYKIYILDEAHQITDAAFNALLKTLEEPPEHIVFMMATTQPEDIPQTVRSRCQHFSFHAVKMADILQELRGIADREGVEADEGTLGLLAEAGDGSMRDALSIMDQAIASAPVHDNRPHLDAGQIRELMGTVSNAVFERVFDAVDDNRSAEVITVANEMLDAGNSPSQLARQCVRYLRNCLMAKISGITPEGVTADGAAAELLQISPDERRRAGRTAAHFSEEELTRFLQVMLRTFDELGYRQEPRFHFELGLLKLVHLRRLLPMEEVLSALPNSSALPRPSGVNAAATASAPVPGKVSLYAAIEAAPPSKAPTSRTRFAPSSPSASPTPTVPAGSAFSPFQAGAITPQRSTSSVPSKERTPEPASNKPVTAAPPLTNTIPADESPSTTSGFGARQSPQPAEPTPRPPAPPLTPVLLGPTDSAFSPMHSATDLQQLVVDAVATVKGQSSAADALAQAIWSFIGNTVRVQTLLSKRMLPIVINAEAEKVARTAFQQAAPGLKLELVPAPADTATANAPKKPRATRSGSAQAKAEGHPVVQEAQRLFEAEISTVIDLSDTAS